MFDEPLPQPRNPRNEISPAVAGWRMRIGLYSADADFIRQQAVLQLAVSCLAIIVLIMLSIYLLRMLNRYLEVKAREGAEAQLKSLGIMAASLAHEIRNPLGAMKGLTQLAKEDLPPEHGAQEQLSTVVSEAERLEQLVTDLLDFARPKKPQISEFDMMNLLSDIKVMLQSKMESANVAIQFSIDAGPLRIQSDPRGLRQVLLNVLINAVDASPPGSEVILRIIRGENNRSIIIHVDDAVDALLMIASSNDVNGRVFNMGSDNPISLKDLADLLVEINGEGKYVTREFPADRKRIDIGDYCLMERVERTPSADEYHP